MPLTTQLNCMQKTTEKRFNKSMKMKKKKKNAWDRADLSVHAVLGQKPNQVK